MKIDKKIITNLREEYGDAFYLLDSEQFQKNFIELRDTFRSIYPNFNIAYSYKTNYTPKFCKLVDKMGGYAEVVSEMEMEIALRCGVKHNRIIWNGPIKNSQKLEEFLVAGGIDNVDCIEELDIIKGIAKRHPSNTINLGIRCNYEVGDGVVSRFGFDVDSDDFKKILDYVQDTTNVHFYNFQCHFAKRQIEYWPARAKGMVELIDRLGIIPERIDIGGGLFGKMDDSLKAQFSGEIPNYQQYASPCFHSPFISVSIALASSAGSSPTNSLVPIRQVSGCSAYVFSVMQGMPRKVASSATLPESVMIPFALLMRYPKKR